MDQRTSDYIEKVVAEAPALTDAQKVRLRPLLNPPRRGPDHHPENVAADDFSALRAVEDER